jgi:dihydrofolate reductase
MDLAMSKVIVSGFSLSIDGYGAGPNQSVEEPLGKGGEDLHEWVVGTRAFQQIRGKSGGSEGIDSDYAARFTTFHFVTEGIEAALEQAKAAADGKTVTIGGGVATVRQNLRTGLIDEAHFAIAPVMRGRGEAMFADIDLPALGYRITEHAATAAATHIVL